MTSLNLASNNLGELVLPTGWTAHLADDGKRTYYVTEGQPSQWEAPSGTTPEGAIALANAIPDMRAMTKLTVGDQQPVTMTTEMTAADFSGKFRSCEARIVAAFLPKCP
jgi:hypothetical protein